MLAGGASRRMGRPKALLEVGGRPLIERPLTAIRAAGLEAVIVAPAGSPLPATLDAAVWHEPAAGPRHPARGLAHALEQAGGPIVALACDLPFVTAEFVRWLAEQSGTVVPRAGGRLQPLLARYEPAAAGPLAEAAAAGASLTAVVAAIANATPALEDERVAINLNTPEDLLRSDLGADPASGLGIQSGTAHKEARKRRGKPL